MTSPAKQALLSVRGLLADKERWTQLAYARNRDDVPIHPTQGAAAWCMVGAIERQVPDPDVRSETVLQVLSSIRRLYPGATTITDFNDRVTTTHEDVLRVLDDAIEHVA